MHVEGRPDLIVTLLERLAHRDWVLHFNQNFEVFLAAALVKLAGDSFYLIEVKFCHINCVVDIARRLVTVFPSKSKALPPSLFLH